MDMIGNDKLALSQTPRNAVTNPKIPSCELPIPQPALPSISRSMSKTSLLRHPLPIRSGSISACRHLQHPVHHYNYRNASSFFMRHDTSCPYTSPSLQLGPGYSLAGRGKKSDSDNNGIDPVIHIPRMMPRAIGGTIPDRLSPLLPLPDICATIGRVDAGIMATTVSPAGITVRNATYQQQQMKNAQLHYCHLCDKRFKRKSWLQRHLLSHSPQRHFGCPWCLSKHKRKDNLLQHMKLKHTGLVLREMQNQNHCIKIEDGARNNDIKGLLDRGRLNKDNVKKALNALIDKYNE